MLVYCSSEECFNEKLHRISLSLLAFGLPAAQCHQQGVCCCSAIVCASDAVVGIMNILLCSCSGTTWCTNKAGACCCSAILCALYVARGFHIMYCCALVIASQVDVRLLVSACQKQDSKQALRQAVPRCLTDQMAALDAWWQVGCECYRQA